VKRRLIPAAIAVLAIALGVAFVNAPDGTPGPKPTDTTTTTPSPTATILEGFYAQQPVWTDCGEGFQCTTIDVPLDYSDPGRRSISIALNRLQVKDPTKKIGSLLVNPGGPGASGLEYARSARYIVTDEILARFDIVGFDPRGVGASTEVRCLNDREQDEVLALDQSPDNNVEIEAAVVAAKLLANRCEQNAGDLIGFLGSADVARDMDIIRAVVGDDRLYYLGKSYGTYLGTIYADLFPKKVGRLVLDGAIDPTVSERDANLTQAKGFEKALNAFINHCVKFKDCSLGRDPKAARQKILTLLADVDRKPLKSDDGRQVTQSLTLIGIVSSLYDQEYGWPILEEALRDAFAGDGSILLALSDEYVERDRKGHYRTNSNDISYIVTCLDRTSDITVDQSKADQIAFAKVAPVFGPFLAWSLLPCDYWVPEARPYPAPIAAKGAAPILVVGTLRDPATPYAWAQGLAEQLESGRLLSWDGDGHTAYMRGSTCVDRAVDRYLISGSLPELSTVCK
jgi:pimeloyl-ACP methyl ester carboxylesterase